MTKIHPPRLGVLGALVVAGGLALTGCAGNAGQAATASFGSAAQAQAAPAQAAPAQAAPAAVAEPAQPPSDNAEYCRRTDPLEVQLPEEDNRRLAANDLARQAKIWQEVQPFAPWGLRSDLQLLAKDYDALSTGAKTFPEALPEVRPAFARVMEHRKAIC
ncbi:hypothetical protein GCM10023321_36130 [Pseudonocardia eucalypti]|uniref:Lipoprotein n=1 Tax=Pseudonocardia eucalypti TaxID=648755 RepID=A0ABP9Q7D7_9PSEU|nr:cell wall-associated NlpC family hydrolase [Pseudonocardia eucalypti]